MSEKKNIDRLFQERFKDFEATPNDAVWDKIKSQQQKKERKLVLIPLWYRVAGVAALVALIFTLGNSYFNQKNNPTIELVTNQTSTEKKQTTQKTTTPEKTPVVTEKIVKVEEEGSSESSSANNAIANQQNLKGETTNPKTKSPSKRLLNPSISDHNPSMHTNKNANSTGFNSSQSDIKPNLNKAQNYDQEIVAQQSKLSKPQLNSESIDQEQIINNNYEDTTASEETITNMVTIDTTKKSIYEAINEELAVKDKTKEPKKWNIMPSIAPVFYNSLGNGSSIAAQYADNDKITEANLSYGVQVAYEVTDRIHIRGGVHKLNLSYTTQDVGLSRSIVSNSLNSITPETSDLMLVDLFEETSSLEDSSPSSGDLTNTPFTTNIPVEGAARQRLGYIEVPLEMTYALSNKRLGVHLIGGVSTLFLNENENTLTFDADDGSSTDIGQADNLNTFSFSGNLGLGMDYKISQRFKLHVEPIFKYQVNAYGSDTDFNPYIFGVYTGLSFKF